MLWRALALSRYGLALISITVAATLAAAVSSAGAESANPASTVNLLDLQVFAKHNIRAHHSDFQDNTAAGGDIDLSDFAILGNLMAGGHVSFVRGTVSGAIAAKSMDVSQVNYGGTASHAALKFDLLSHRLDQLGARLANLPITADAAVFERVENGRPVKHIDIAATRSLDVVELKADQFVSAWPRRVSVDIRGDDTTRLVVRVLGYNPRWRNIGFTLSGGIGPADVVFFFPQAEALEVSDSGGAVDGLGRPVGIPGSIVAPNASLQFASALVTGQVFARDIASLPGSPSGQVDRLRAAADPSMSGMAASFHPNRALAQIDADLWSARCSTAEK